MDETGKSGKNGNNGKDGRIDALLFAMIEHEAPDAARIQHFIKVHAFARLIGIAKHLPADTQETLEAAAIVHDIGIHPAEQKYGRCDGPLQEQEGPPLARALLASLGFPAALVERAAYLVGHHHTYTDIDGADYRILAEADFLVNLHEGKSTDEAQREAYRKIFRTDAGKRLFRAMFCTARPVTGDRPVTGNQTGSRPEPGR